MEFYLKYVKKGRWYYARGDVFEKTGKIKRVSKAHVLRAKKKVVSYSVLTNRINSADAIKKQKIVHSESNFVDKEILDKDILSQSIKRSINIGVERGKKVALKYKGKIREINVNTPERLKAFLDFTDAIQTAYFENFKGVTNSPIFFVSYLEGKKGIVYDYDNTMIGNDDEISDEFPDEIKQFNKDVKKIFNKLK